MLSSTPGGGYAARPVNSTLDLVLHRVRSTLRRTNSRLLGVLARSVDLGSQPFRKKYLPLNARALISLSQPIDPLRRAKNLPAIELVIPFVEKDLRALPVVLEHAIANIRNPVGQVTLITPRNAEGTGPRFVKPESTPALENLLAANPQVRLVFDQDLLGGELLDKLQSRFGSGDRNAGWVMQQLIKLSAALQSTYPGALILDSDTVLLTKKTWLTSKGKQLLQVAIEYHSDFMRHLEMFFGVTKKHRLSFITHHQLMQPDVVREMFPEGQKSLIAWWESSSDPIGRDLGDYEAYGSFLAYHHPTRVAYGSFGNLFSPALDQFLYDMKTLKRTPLQLISDYCSVSFHSWAQVPRKDSPQAELKEETPK